MARRILSGESVSLEGAFQQCICISLAVPMELDHSISTSYLSLHFSNVAGFGFPNLHSSDMHIHQAQVAPSIAYTNTSSFII